MAGHFHQSERRSKKYPTGQAGVFMQFKAARGRRAAEVCLLVLCRDRRFRSLYVGTPQTYAARLNQKISEAAALSNLNR